MTIYFNKTTTNFNHSQFKNYIKSPEIPAHEKIGALFSRVLTSQNPTLPLTQLGVSANDNEALTSMRSLVQSLGQGNIKIISTENTGVFFIQKQLEETTYQTPQFQNIAVFKIGRRRAAMETMVRTVAHSLGLSRHVTAGMFCALINPPLVFSQDSQDSSDDETEDTIEELFNGNEKIYREKIESKKESKLHEDDIDNNQEIGFEFDTSFQEKLQIEQVPSEEETSDTDSAETTACAIVGIIQPFLVDQQPASLLDFTLMTILALAIGLRDGKEDGYKGSTFFDTDDCMPIRIDPIIKNGEIDPQTVSAIDLPYLDQDPRTHEKLSLEEIGILANMVQNWDTVEILAQLSTLKILYEDRVAESLAINDINQDEGSCLVEIQATEPPHLINGQLNHLTHSNSQRHLLLSSQRNAFNIRITRLRDFIIESQIKSARFTPQELVFTVDRFGGIFYRSLSISPLHGLRRDVAQTLSNQGAHHLIGRTTPENLGVMLRIPKNSFQPLHHSSSDEDDSLRPESDGKSIHESKN